MKKKKDGTVIASLTEVKNKTGDIFALADEYGEVILTSYNKPRYKIVKLDISNILEYTEEEQKPKNKSEERSVEETIVTEVKPAMIDKLINVTPWQRDNSREASFSTNATKGLL